MLTNLLRDKYCYHLNIKKSLRHKSFNILPKVTQLSKQWSSNSGPHTLYPGASLLMTFKFIILLQKFLPCVEILQKKFKVTLKLFSIIYNPSWKTENKNYEYEYFLRQSYFRFRHGFLIKYFKRLNIWRHTKEDM